MSAQAIVIADNVSELKKLTASLDFLAASHGGKSALIQPAVRGFLIGDGEGLEERAYNFPGLQEAKAFESELERVKAVQSLKIQGIR